MVLSWWVSLFVTVSSDLKFLGMDTEFSLANPSKQAKQNKLSKIVPLSTDVGVWNSQLSESVDRTVSSPLPPSRSRASSHAANLPDNLSSLRTVPARTVADQPKPRPSLGNLRQGSRRSASGRRLPPTILKKDLESPLSVRAPAVVHPAVPILAEVQDLVVVAALFPQEITSEKEASPRRTQYSEKWIHMHAIHPAATGKLAWDWLIIALVVYNAVVVPLQVGFPRRYNVSVYLECIGANIWGEI